MFAARNMLFAKPAAAAGGDADADAIIAAIESADAATLESALKTAINAFVVGCKADASPNGGVSNWAALDYLFVTFGARTRAGAVIPWKAATTVTGGTGGTYDRKNGFYPTTSGDRLTLGAARFDDFADQNNASMGAWVYESMPESTTRIIGAGSPSEIFGRTTGSTNGARARAMRTSIETIGDNPGDSLYGFSRNSSANHQFVGGTQDGTVTSTSTGIGTAEILFPAAASFVTCKAGFVGRAVDLVALRTRLADLNTVIQSL